MLVCDRCGKKLTYQERKESSVTMTIYAAQAAYIGHILDLCNDCKRLYSTYKDKMESYFMVNDDPIKLLDEAVYWDRKKKY